MKTETSLMEFKAEITTNVKVVVFDYDPGCAGNGIDDPGTPEYAEYDVFFDGKLVTDEEIIESVKDEVYERMREEIA
jgi:copper chaperone CopZ